MPEGRAIVLSVEGNFHGRTLRVISMSTDHSHGGFGPTFHDKGKIRTIRYGAIEDLECALDLHGECDVVFLVEPVLRESPLSTLPAHLSDDLVSIVSSRTKYNVLLICNEIQTGLGRTDKVLCCKHDQIRPNIVLLGKALSAGVYLVSVVVADRNVMYCICPGEHVVLMVATPSDVLWP
ncbi:hypothetical protein SCLCIDRAFT_1155035 [Scleroderma citrinum Foug A]|uniref:Ornithine aminotransferase n=1 Tax=Scleroderma citrinum Foug A TaxID=1036808 RepID=A0A0C3DCI6_9AGAM|nr:hypothetical protein SCLCIDRAFT_1155035 [Scleroderma citrinum Foug A]